MPEKKITPIHYTILVKIFELDGFEVTRTRGDHIIMTKQGVRRPLVIKTSSHEVPVTHMRTNMSTANMDRERYFELLEKAKR